MKLLHSIYKNKPLKIEVFRQGTVRNLINQEYLYISIETRFPVERYNWNMTADVVCIDSFEDPKCYSFENITEYLEDKKEFIYIEF